MPKTIKDYIIIIALIVYVLSPLDLFPGPVDDIAMTILYLFYNKNIKK